MVFITTMLEYSKLIKIKLINWSILDVLIIRLNQGQMKTKMNNDFFDSAKNLS